MATLADLRTRFYARFDEGAQNYIQAAEANSLLNEGASHLHNWLLSEGENYYWKEQTVPLVANTGDYSLPSDFQKLLKLFGPASYPSAVSSWRPLRRLMPQEYRGPSYGVAQGPYPFTPQAYMLMGQTLRIIPTPQNANQSLLLWYAPQYTPLVNDTDTTELAVFPGAEEFIVNQAVIGARIKEESDTSDLERRQGVIQQMIQQSVINRDMGQHAHVVDSHGGESWHG